jgi:hypothetical protein
MAKRKKQSKRKTGARKKRAPRFSKPITRKRRGKNIFDIHFSGKQTLNRLEEQISELPANYKMPRDARVKLTVISQVPGEKRRAAVTYIYQDLADPFEVNLSMLDVLYETYYPTDKRKQFGYLRKVARGNVSQIVVDFETSGNVNLT